VNAEEPYIAMTFDDGPHATNTPKLLDMLAKRHIKATFFLIGENAKQYPNIVKRIIAEGHEIGNHSWTHPVLSKMSDDAVRSELRRTEDAIVAACGVKPALMRPPYGALTVKQRQWVNAEFGYKIILWDVDPLDWKIRNSEHVEHEILTQVRNGSIILSHDIHATTVAAMPDTLDALLAKGFKFVKVSELLAMDKPKAPIAEKTAAASPESPSHADPDAAATPKPNGKRKHAN
jgi:peptidoglycan/xylan/chitin deacetylase (PgdA/CDA1 family)